MPARRRSMRALRADMMHHGYSINETRSALRSVRSDLNELEDRRKKAFKAPDPMSGPNMDAPALPVDEPATPVNTPPSETPATPSSKTITFDDSFNNIANDDFGRSPEAPSPNPPPSGNDEREEPPRKVFW